MTRPERLRSDRWLDLPKSPLASISGDLVRDGGAWHEAGDRGNGGLCSSKGRDLVGINDHGEGCLILLTVSEAD